VFFEGVFMKTLLTIGKNYATWCPQWQATSNANVKKAVERK
jgi:hypothetical protein